ncbi:MAG: hypothetical protein K2X81_00325, partial [Candidatus Obscuribacterales bacterium]|nr:hypothetical protein [Candidatus Obscuribacterales bacterium]
LPKLIKSTGWPNAVYTQIKTVPDLAAFGPERRDLLRTLWTLIEMGCTTESICKQLRYDRYTVLSAIDEVIKVNWVKQEEGPKITDELRRRTGQFSKPSLQDLMQIAKGEKPSGTVESPFELVKVINAMNGVSTNLGLMYGKVEVRMLLQEALAKTSKTFPVLTGLRVHIDSPCLDMRGASSEFSTSPDNIAALLLLGNNLMELVLKMQVL